MINGGVMLIKIKLVSAAVLIALFFVSCTKSHVPRSVQKFSNFTGEYIGQTIPDTIPQLFAPGFISTGFRERDAAYSKDGSEFYFTLMAKGSGVILFVKMIDGKWTKPEIVSFSGEYSDMEPFISADNSKIYFVSNRPIEADGEVKDYDIWFAERTDDGWSEPQNIGAPISSDKDEFYPTLTSSGAIYFTAAYDDAVGGEDIYMSEFVDGKYQTPKNILGGVNSKRGEFNSYISPDESFLIYSTWGREDGFGGGDLYISFMHEDGSWGEPKNMGDKINSNYLEYCPAFSPDGKYFYFTSSRTDKSLGESNELTYQKLITLLSKPQNGDTDIYWVESSFIENLR
jgi:Tol biopolymer transport system component